MRQAMAAKQKAIAALQIKDLTRAFLTHLHSDHTIGLPDLILTGAVTGRQGALHIWGPRGTQRMVEHLLQAWSQDIETRIHGGEPAIHEAYQVDVHEFIEGKFYKDEVISVTAFEVQHGTWQNAFGLRFETPDRIIVFSGDTTHCQNLIENASGCDILVHEVYSAVGLAERTADWQQYHSTFHTSTTDVARIANEIQPKLLILNHALLFRQTEEQMLEEIRADYKGDVVLANDLDFF